MTGRYNKGNTRGKLDKINKKGERQEVPSVYRKIIENNNNGFLGLRRGESQFATPSNNTELETKKGNHFLNANNLLKE